MLDWRFQIFGKGEKKMAVSEGRATSGVVPIVTSQRAHFCGFFQQKEEDGLISHVSRVAGDADCSWKLLVQQN